MQQGSQQPPPGSTIEKIEDSEGTTYCLQPPRDGIWRYYSLVMLGIVLGVWSIGLLVGAAFALWHIISGGLSASEGWGFVLWLALASLGEVFLVCCFKRQFSPAVPETLVLGRHSLRYDSGNLPMSRAPAIQAMYYGNSHETSLRMFGKRRQLEACIRELGPVTLTHEGLHQRLTIERGAERFEIGPFLRWAEREWLAAEIQAWQQHR